MVLAKFIKPLWKKEYIYNSDNYRCQEEAVLKVSNDSQNANEKFLKEINEFEEGGELGRFKEMRRNELNNSFGNNNNHKANTKEVWPDADVHNYYVTRKLHYNLAYLSDRQYIDTNLFKFFFKKNKTSKNDFNKLTSGNETIDKFIQDAQLNADDKKVISREGYTKAADVYSLIVYGASHIIICHMIKIWLYLPKLKIRKS
ncbi:hypothetical protein Glove_606g43 [Diversispora epigaea]|uniref:Uncharacterized protein n=1 Tax=Diversispora epigaea TaxID=1348612 RepID=A0A397GAD3_9GLOM|nr:hypothetical protein Glove_606g43 [Diversispora epigaea]